LPDEEITVRESTERWRKSKRNPQKRGRDFSPLENSKIKPTDKGKHDLKAGKEGTRGDFKKKSDEPQKLTRVRSLMYSVQGSDKGIPPFAKEGNRGTHREKNPTAQKKRSKNYRRLREERNKDMDVTDASQIPRGRDPFRIGTHEIVSKRGGREIGGGEEVDLRFLGSEGGTKSIEEVREERLAGKASGKS